MIVRTHFDIIIGEIVHLINHTFMITITACPHRFCPLTAVWSACNVCFDICLLLLLLTEWARLQQTIEIEDEFYMDSILLPVSLYYRSLKGKINENVISTLKVIFNWLPEIVYIRKCIKITSQLLLFFECVNNWLLLKCCQNVLLFA